MLYSYCAEDSGGDLVADAPLASRNGRRGGPRVGREARYYRSRQSISIPILPEFLGSGRDGSLPGRPPPGRPPKVFPSHAGAGGGGGGGATFALSLSASF